MSPMAEGNRIHKFNLQYVIRKMQKWKQPESCVSSILQRKCLGHVVVFLSVRMSYIVVISPEWWRKIKLEDITWPRGYTNFIFECWRDPFSTMFCSLHTYWWNFHIKDNLFYSFSKQQKAVIYCKMPVTEMFWSSDIKYKGEIKKK